MNHVFVRRLAPSRYADLNSRKGLVLPPIVVSVAVLRDGQVLLTMREDFQVWCLPSGGVEFGEPVADAALRETREETGLDVRLTRLVGVYSRIGA
ncbi:MAG: NUDIX domain-containing protein, partial [Chloroflexota bacterium]|nr:NUDIX domain-containing protein [Chloroflexota bacterium]